MLSVKKRQQSSARRGRRGILRVRRVDSVLEPIFHSEVVLDALHLEDEEVLGLVPEEVVEAGIR